MNDRTAATIITGLFPVVAVVGFIGLFVAASRKRQRLAVVFGMVCLIGLLAMLWAEWIIFPNA